MANGAELAIRSLEQADVQWVFGIPGEENIDFIEALRKSNIKLVLTRHEQAAGFMAATVGRLTGCAGVCLSTLGPGATNLVTAAAYAQLGAMPMLMLTGQKPLHQSDQGQFQIIDIVDMMQPISKHTMQLISANHIAAAVNNAFRVAEEERPGAVHLEIPEDIAREEANAKPIPINSYRRPIAENKVIEKTVQLLQKSKHPLLIIAAGANRKRTSKTLYQFIKKFSIPFITTQMGKGVVNENDPLFLGNAALSEGDFLHQAIDKADLILNVGHDLMEKPPFIMASDCYEVVHINFNTAKVDPIYFPQTEVIGDIANVIWQITNALAPQKHWDFDYFKQVKQALERNLSESIHDKSFPIKPQRFVHDLRQVIPDDGIITLDNGMYKIWIARNYKASQSNSVILDNALATMGAGLPSAIATKLVFPERLVVAVCGDGGFMMNSQELETAVRLKLDLVVIVLSDQGFGMIKWKQSLMDFDEYGLDFANPDFNQYAQSYGAKGKRVTEIDQFRPALQHCIEAGGVWLLEVPIDYSDTVYDLGERIKNQCESINPGNL